MLDQRLVDGLMEAIAPVIRSAIVDATGKATAPLLERIAVLEARGPEKGEQGEAGKSVTLDDVRPVLQEMVAALPPAEPGKSVTLDDVRPLLEEMVAALPKPADGKSVTLDDVRPLVVELVAALPPAEPGKSVTLDDVRPLIAEAVAAIPAPQDGKSVTLDEVRPMIEAAIAAIPRPQDGKSVTLDDVKPLIEDAIAAIPKPADGKSVTVDDVRPILQEMVAALPPAEQGPPGAPGKPGEPGEKGRDGRDASDLSVIMDIAAKQAEAAVTNALTKYEVVTPDGGRTLEFKFMLGETEVSRTIKTALPLDKGVWREGPFEPGDGVTLGGHFWIAQASTTAKPAESKDWRLAVQRGRNGKDFRPDDARGQKADPVRLA